MKTDEVLREFPAVGKYRIRVVKRTKGLVLDVREYVTADAFEGFTRRGISVNVSEAVALGRVMDEAIEAMKEGGGA